MPHLPSASLRPSLLALAIVSTLPGVAFAAADEMTVTATGNARSAFEAPMMVSVIDATAPEKQTASSAADLLRNVPGLTLDGTGRTNGQDVNLRGYDRRGVLVLVVWGGDRFCMVVMWGKKGAEAMNDGGCEAR